MQKYFSYQIIFLTSIFLFCLHTPISAESPKRLQIGSDPLDLTNSEHPVVWNARWIQDPLFRLEPYYHFLRKEDDKVPVQTDENDPRDIHTLYRKTFRLRNEDIASAKLFITADDMYKLYVNEQYIGLGPAPAYLFAYPYNGWDVTDEMIPGDRNCLAVHVYYQGLVNRVWASGDNQQGLLAQLEVLYRDGQSEIIGSDDTWRYHRSEINSATRTIGYKTQFAEDLDLNKAIPEWKSASFDDSGWSQPYVSSNPVPGLYTLVPQETPPLALEKVWPAKVVKTGEGRCFIDFGTELTGSTCFIVTGPKNHVVEIRHGEELSGENEVRYDMRAGCLYQEFCTLSGREEERIEFFDYKGFRYVEVLNWPEELDPENVWVFNRHYPFSDDACSFESSDELLNRIWNLCRNGVEQGTQDTYLDCPTREKGGYLGDAYVTGQSHLYLTGDIQILRKALQDFAHSGRICPGLMAVAPGNYMQEIADYSLLWPIVLERYYLWSGDLEFVKSMRPILDGLLEYFARYENRNGLLENVDEKWNLVDWPDNLRDNYDYDRAAQGVNTVLNHFYYGALSSSARLYNHINDTENAEKTQAKAERVGRAARESLLEDGTGLFIDAAGSSHSSLHANALPLMFELQPGSGSKRIVEFLTKKRIQCGVYFASFLLEGLYNAGQAQTAYDLITSHDKHSWYTMLEAGATTCMEAWGPDQKWNTSWCHPWSSCPIFIVAGELMGLKPKKPGWDEIAFAPKPPANLEWANISVTTPKGEVKTSFTQDDETIVYRLNIPEQSCAEVMLLNIHPEVLVNEKKYTCTERKDKLGGIRFSVPVKLRPGEHTIKATKK